MFLWVSENFYEMDVRWKPFEENGKVAGAKLFLSWGVRNQGHLPRKRDKTNGVIMDRKEP